MKNCKPAGGDYYIFDKKAWSDELVEVARELYKNNTVSVPGTWEIYALLKIIATRPPMTPNPLNPLEHILNRYGRSLRE